MKKQIFFIIFAISLFVVVKSAFAATTPTPTPAVSTTEQQINTIKDMVASSVAAMHLMEKRGFIGKVTDNTETQITVNDMMGNSRSIDVDELTQFSSPSAKTSFGISDITKGTT